MEYKSVNPFTNQEISVFEEMSPEQADRCISQTKNAFETWGDTSFTTRSVHMKKLAGLLESGKEEFAALITSEMGKTLREAVQEIEKCAWVCSFYAENAEAFLKKTYVETEGRESSVIYRPLGIILAVMPWNFPFWQVFRFAAPAIMAGNGALLKHAPNVFGCAQAIEQLFRDAGFPPGILKALLISEKETGRVIEHPDIKAVTLTGSTNAGKSVAATAAAVLKKSVLELGGSDPYIVLEDASIATAVDVCTQSRLMNAGQSCISAKRFIVVSAVYDDFLDQLKTAFEHIVMGNPEDDHTDIGPMARPDLRDALHDQVTRSIKSGAHCILGGEIPEIQGCFYPPTILADVIPGMPAFDEELFGPVAAVIRAQDEEEAIMLANQTKYGLGAAIFTADIERGREIAENRLEAGSCFVNDLVRSDPRLPFGGIKESGFGRELGSFGIHEFVNIKTIGVSE